MKKIIVFLFVLVVFGLYINEKENILIPDESIRFRIIANSDKPKDQALKLTIKNDVEKELYKLVKDAKNMEEARSIISNNLDKVDMILKRYNIDYKIDYGFNYFPEKEYKGITYKEGNYESLVITLDKGLGKNWWCVLFPPLCLLDDMNNLDNKEYTYLVKELVNKLK